MAGFFMHNGKLLVEGSNPISPANRSFRYGDGLFETIRLVNNKMPLWSLHLNRLWAGLTTLKFEIPKLFTPEMLQEEIFETCRKNGLVNARVRLNVFRGEGGLYDPENLYPNYVIETWPLPESVPHFNINGLQVGVYEKGKKSTDVFANLKSNNFLLYAMAALYAREHQWNDAIVLNSENRIADSSTANIFWVNGHEIFTTPLTEGPVNGVMRKSIMNKLGVTEKSVSKEEILEADEVFFTNAVRGIQWVAAINGNQRFTNSISQKLYNDIIFPVFSQP